jgi:RNA polymerase sigma factor (sigma-70 family)
MMGASQDSGSVLRSLRTLFSVGTVGGMMDGQLLEQFLSRRDEAAEAAFAALVAFHGPMVWDVCRGILSDSHAAEDAFQATFLVLVRRAGSIRRRDAVGPWLHGVARRIAVRAKAVAARRRLREAQEQEQEMTTTSDPDPSRREQFEALHQEVDRLAEKYRAPLVLCYLEGRTHAEAARLLRCPVGTVSVRLSRARDLLRARLTRRGVVLPAIAAVVGGGATLGPATTASAMPMGLADSTIKAAMQLAAAKVLTAGVVPASVAQLVGGEMRTMILTKWTLVATGLLAAGSVSVGIGLRAAYREPDPRDFAPEPRAAATAQDDAKEEAARAQAESIKNLKTIALAMHVFASSHENALPTAAIRKDGKPLLSWRVAILPYIDQGALYDKFHLDEPWDSPHNKALLDHMPAVYAPVTNTGKLGHSTHYQVFTGSGTLFDGDEGTKLADIKDGTSMTFLIVEGAKPVPWTKPEELPFDADKPLPKLGGQIEGGFYVAMADGSARFINRKAGAKVLQALITSNGRENVTADEF